MTIPEFSEQLKSDLHNLHIFLFLQSSMQYAGMFCASKAETNAGLSPCQIIFEIHFQFFETQPKLASTVQTNLLIYACLSTVIVLAMTCCQVGF